MIVELHPGVLHPSPMHMFTLANFLTPSTSFSHSIMMSLRENAHTEYLASLSKISGVDVVRQNSEHAIWLATIKRMESKLCSYNEVVSTRVAKLSEVVCNPA